MSPEKVSVQKMFDDISPRYDFLNHFLSLGVDIRWRRILAGMLSGIQPRRILDVASGTGDVAIELSRLNPEKIIGLDISEKMLETGRRKVTERGLDNIITFRKGDAEHIPFSDSSFDAVTVAFGVRNFENLRQGLAEMKRVLRPGGTMLILEFSQPSTFPFKYLYRLYSRIIIPFFGRLISRHSHAYSYLPETAASFPSGEMFLNILRELEMSDCSLKKLSFGISAIYSCKKPDKIKNAVKR